MNYIQFMRNFIGHETLITIGCGVIIEKEHQILLQHRLDVDNWCIPGGLMELGETFQQTAIREVFEETGLEVYNLELFGIYSGKDCFVEYPNKDKAYSVQIIFKTLDFKGELLQKSEESREHKFFARNKLPNKLNPRQENFIMDWVKNAKLPIIN